MGLWHRKAVQFTDRGHVRGSIVSLLTLTNGSAELKRYSEITRMRICTATAVPQKCAEIRALSQSAM